jgi:hypothetical protein
MNPYPSPDPKEKGQSLAELAISLVLLILVIAGVVDFGRLFLNHIAMRDGTEEGAVYGSINPTHCTQIEERVRSSLSDPDGSQVTITIDGVPCNSATKSIACEGHKIEVAVRYPNFPLTMPLIGLALGRQTLDLEVKINHTILRPACQAIP